MGDLGGPAPFTPGVDKGDADGAPAPSTLRLAPGCCVVDDGVRAHLEEGKAGASSLLSPRVDKGDDDGNPA
eukprot:12150685-Alexandrium_andersonii.AAC.1